MGCSSAWKASTATVRTCWQRRAIRNDPKFEIQYHAGHRRFSTTEEYLHLADGIRRGFGDVFPELPADLIEAARALPFAGLLDQKLDHAAE